MRLFPPLLAASVAALCLTLAGSFAPSVASADRINAPSHDAGLGFHTIRFRTEDGDVYSLHALTLTFDYWVGRTYGLMLHGEAFFPMRGAQPGSGEDYRGSIRRDYEQHWGIDGSAMFGMRHELRENLHLYSGVGLHLQSFRINDAAYSAIEAVTMPGKGVITRTGSLGDVMKESVEAARTVVRSRSRALGIKDEAFEKRDVHIHVPDGATPKDGPSAGIAMFTAIASAFTQRLIKPHMAMTGEITLRGKVLPVGGIKEKILAARRAGIKDIILPKDNQKDIDEIKPVYLKGVTFHYVSQMIEVINLALTSKKAASPLEINY